MTGSIPLPLSEDNPLILSNNEFKQFIERKSKFVTAAQFKYTYTYNKQYSCTHLSSFLEAAFSGYLPFLHVP